MSFFKKFGMSGCALWFSMILTSGVIAAESSSPSQLTLSQAESKRWSEGLTLLGTGKLDQATSLILEVARNVDDASVAKVKQWLESFEEFQEARRSRIQADYDKYVQWAKEDIAAGRWRQAILDCDLAYNYCFDKEKFRQEPWVQEAVEGVVDLARKYESEGEWYKAAGIYAQLNDMFYLEKSYRQALERCQEHIRIDLTYIPSENEDDEKADEDLLAPDWESNVVHIVPRMTRDALRKVHNDYIREPDFKELTIAALEQVLRFIDEPGMERVFPSLSDEDEVESFRSRVEAKLQQAKAREQMTVSDLIAYFNRVLTINDETGMLPQNVLIYEFTHGSMAPLDEFTDMIWPAERMEFNKHTQGRFSGVGISIRKELGKPIRVVTPLEDTPAYRAGIQPGDEITKINGKSAKKYRIMDAVREITGPPGTTVTLTIQRLGVPNPFDVTLERQEITIFTVKGHQRDEDGRWKFMIDPKEKIGYLRLTNFTDNSIDEMRDIIGQLEGEGMRGLIFDLRANPGGPLRAAIEVADMFLEEKQNIVSTRDREGRVSEMSSTREGSYLDFPMIVLINEVSASASEIVAGALQVHGRALIVGERSFGKGSVQQVLFLNNSGIARLKLTTARYYLPNGRSLHREEEAEIWGVDPNVEVPLVIKEERKGNEARLKNDILKGKGQDSLSDEVLDNIVSGRNRDDEETKDEEPEKETATETTISKEAKPEDLGEDEDWVIRDDDNNYPEIDPQLETALLLMRVRLETGQQWPLGENAPSEVAVTGASSSGG